ncbi:aspartate-semialdehyde dehydrogenase [Ramaria rubella]|nr:aspartate-semialdehyde dehydrogenase [Ramaria rubella]
MRSQRSIKVGVLGATGTVGQRFILILAKHPYFQIHALGASSRSAGQSYARAVKWKQTSPIPKSVREILVQECAPQHFAGVEIVFSGLDADVAGDIELAFRAANVAVFSNAKNHRRDPVVPLVVPLVNTSHLSIIPYQQSLLNPRPTRGFIVTNANCAATGVVVPLAALEQAFGPLDAVLITTMQAVSGAGYPGVPSLDIFDNVIPYIGGGEEDKLEWEVKKILGGMSPDGHTFDLHEPTPLKVSAACNRVPVLEGHMECVSVRFARHPPPSVEQVWSALRQYTCEALSLGCPSAPAEPIVVHDEQDRPQPRLDRNYQDGAGVSVGRVRGCPVLDIKFVVLANNVAIGAATSSIINAEVAVEKGYIKA